MESGQADGGGLVISGGQAAPLLELVDAPLDGVALFVGVAVEGRRRKRGRVTSLAGREDGCQGAAVAVGGEVDLGSQSAPGPSEGMVVRLAGLSPF